MGVRDVFIFPRRVLRCFGACGIFLALILPPPIVYAATFTVTNLNDSGVGSLRQAILDANNVAGDDTIVFQAGTSGVLLSTGNLTATGNLTINGPGASLLTLSGALPQGGTSNTLLQINNGVTVIISGLTIANSFYGIKNQGTLAVNNCNISNNSTGIDNSGYNVSQFVSLTVNNSTLSENSFSGITSFHASLIVNSSALFNNKGGIYNDNGPLTINNSTLSSNNGAGGVYNYGNSLTINNCTIAENIPYGISSANSPADDLTITNSTISGNTTGGDCGGGIRIGVTKNVTLSNNTISGNRANRGGGLCIGTSTLGKVRILNTTITGNTATSGGGGIYIDNGSTLEIGNSLVAGNTSFTEGSEIYNHPYNPLGSNPNAFTSLAHNLFGQNGSSGFTNANPSTNDLILASPIATAISSLANNGGPTLTHLPVAGGPLVDAGNNALIPANVTTDQRGQPRIQFGKVDIGAVEVDTVSPAQTLIDNYYRTILGRAPDAGGLAFWQDEVSRLRGLGVDVQEVFRVMAGWFFNSAEYLGKNTSDSQYVTDLYRTFFQRSPDSGGLGYWTGQLAAGMPRSVVLFSFLFSTEFGSYMQGLLGDTASRAEVYAVVDFYRGFLNRLADDGGFNYWIGRFRAAQCQGAAAVNAEVDSISTQYLGSGEYTGRNRSNRDYVADLYYAFLRRGGELTGFNFWVNQLNGGLKTREQLRQEFLKSAEFQGRVSQIIGQGCL